MRSVSALLGSIMKKLIAVIAAVSLVGNVTGISADEKGDVKAQMQALIGKVQAKLKAGTTTEEGLREELTQFDTLLAEHKGEKTDDVANILFMKAMLYLQVLDDPEKGEQSILQLKNEFPDTKPGKSADTIIASLAKQKQAKKMRAALKPGAPFPDFNETDLDGKPLSISGLKGKVVLIDFWATWCGPCVAELPNVLKTYETNHAKGLEIIGISLDQEKEKLTAFLSEHKVPWPQFFDGQGWSNKLGVMYGVTSIPATYLLDRDGKIIATDLRGDELDKAVVKALGSM